VEESHAQQESGAIVRGTNAEKTLRGEPAR
jgi:hypothetical protein